jgi:hypothetical protein
MIKQKRPPSSMKDFVNLLIDKGNFSICRLPHYRFRGEQSHYDRLRKAGMVVVTGKDEVTLNLKATPFFYEWLAARGGERFGKGPSVKDRDLRIEKGLIDD